MDKRPVGRGDWHAAFAKDASPQPAEGIIEPQAKDFSPPRRVAAG